MGDLKLIDTTELQREVKEIFAKQAKEDADIVSACSRAQEMSTGELKELYSKSAIDLKPLGWTKKALRIALDARRSKSRAPFYAVAAHERTGMRIRRTEEAQGQARIGLAIINLPARAERKDDAHVVVIDVEEQK